MNASTLHGARTAALLAAGLVAAAGLPALAQTGRVVTPAETVRAVNPDFPQDAGAAAAGPEDPATAATPGVEGEAPRAGELAVLRGKVAALETRVAQLEEMMRKMTGASSEGSQPPEEAMAGGGETPSEAGRTEEEIQEARKRREEQQMEQSETADEMRAMQDQQRQETQEEIRNRINNAQLEDSDGTSGRGY